jgi:hypothetical protein
MTWRSQKIVYSKVTVKITTIIIKVFFENSLIQKHWYYPTTSIWCTMSETLQKVWWAWKGPPKWKLEVDIMKILNDLKESKNRVFEGYGENHNWNHKSFLWELPYTKALILPHNIDLMHHEWNVAESMMSMCLDVTSFMKDDMNAGKDLAALCDHPLLESKTNAKGNLSRPRAPYCLKPIERKEILKWLKILKFLDCYVANIKWAVNIGTGKLNGLKSHDFRIFIEILMPVMFRGYFKADLWKMFVELNYFYM